MSPALVFDCDGVLARHRARRAPAFNRTFEEAGLPIHWSEQEYGHLLAIGGGKERLATVFTPAFAETAHLPTDPDEQRDLVARWHKAKTAHYTEMVAAGVMPGRPGIARIVAEASAAGWLLAVASTSAEASVRAVLEHAVGAERAAEFAVFAGDVVPAKKPAPGILPARPARARRQSRGGDRRRGQRQRPAGRARAPGCAPRRHGRLPGPADEVAPRMSVGGLDGGL